jgi:putative transposase
MASKGICYKEEQIIRILKEVECGTTVAEVCCQYGVPEQTRRAVAQHRRWRSKYDGIKTSELKWLRDGGSHLLKE